MPEITLHLASELLPLWQMTEQELEASGLAPPYWAFAWAGGQALARYVLDHAEAVRGRQVLDFGSGSGIVAIAAARAGAAGVMASEIDPFAGAAIALNAAANGVELGIAMADLIGTPLAGIEVVLLGDMLYEKPLADRLYDWLEGLAGRGVRILAGDPRRSYFDPARFEPLAVYAVATSRELEDRELRETRVWAFRAR